VRDRSHGTPVFQTREEVLARQNLIEEKGVKPKEKKTRTKEMEHLEFRDVC